MSKIHLLIADDQSIIREGLKSLLSACDDIEIVGEAENGQQLIDMALQLRPDIVLTDIRMPVLDGVEATRQLKHQAREIIVIVLTTFDDDDYIIDAMTGGAAGYLLKDISGAQLVQAIRDSLQGNLILPGRIAAKITARLAQDPPEDSTAASRYPASRHQKADAGTTRVSAADFSAREREIITLLRLGRSNREIADTLFLTVGTVKNYISQIYLKLGVSDRTNAIILLNDLHLPES